ncbi:ATP-binding protein [Actinacidiphila glaucinigra]|uniref:AAA family ATPase n=1 Tax=Actinacidiphila glaucinigra TaxID=235986 RepID=UPI0036F0707D
MPSPGATARPARPEKVFDRESEWSALVDFVCDPRPGPVLGVVTGRPRQGTSFLLEALANAMGGFYFCGQDESAAQSLQRLGDQLERRTNRPAPREPHRWKDAVDALLALGEDRPVPVVVDGIPGLVEQSPSLPALLHRALHDAEASLRPPRTRLFLCGNSTPVMRRLFGAPSPLRGHVRLELVVPPLDFRQAARFWGIEDARLAMLVHAVVGGTPAYRGDFVGDDVPAGLDDFDDWVCRTVLNARLPLFREAGHLVEEATDHRDRALCHSVLTAIASGHVTAGDMAGHLERPLADVSHALATLHDHCVLEESRDILRPAITRYRIVEPLLAFDHAIIRPHDSVLEREPASTVWQRVRGTFHTDTAGRHFADVCRDWAERFAAAPTFGAPAISDAVVTAVSSGSVPVPGRSTGIAVDVGVRGRVGNRPGVLLSVGTASWNEVMGLEHLERLRHVLSDLSERGEDVSRAGSVCYGGAGFSSGLLQAELRGGVVLVGPERLYHGE